jgi:signal transduction histidine kinase
MTSYQEIIIIDIIEDRIKQIHDYISDRFIVYTCDSIESAQEKLKQQKISLIICCQQLVDGSGIDCIKKLHTIKTNTGFVLIVDKSSQKDVLKAIGEGVPVDTFVQWPCTKDQLNDIISNVLIRKMERSLEEKNRMIALIEQREKLANLGELVSGVAHEINNPLSFISSNLGNLKKFVQKLIHLIQYVSDMDLPEPAKSSITQQKESMNYDYIQQRVQNLIDRSILGTDRMKKILLDIKTFSRMAGSDTIKADINESIEISVDLISFQFKEKIKFETNYGPIPEIECNIEKLNQVFMNIIINAIHAIKMEGVIVINTFEKDNHLYIQIKDNGTGIPEDVLPHIFESFYTTKEKGKGTGLGLSICKDIIQHHNGNIDVYSKVGEGTTFTISLPIVI